jgi:REP element-mobilizing transposase RayT
MTDKFKNKYRIPSNRLRGWNYANNGHYFITIVTANRKPLFGNINNGEMQLNEIGQIVNDQFFKSFEMRQELFLGSFVLMPNHLHAIIILDKTNCMYGSAHTTVETHGRASLQQSPTPQEPSTPQQLQRQPKSISSFVAGFKSATIKQIDDWIDSKGLSMEKFNRNNPLWQANYHDHIIRDDLEYQRIMNYIDNNPTNWDADSLNGC